MSREALLTAEELKARLIYEPDTGLFRRRVTAGGRYGSEAGSVAGTKNDQGYVMVSVKSKQHRAHRLAWLYVTGSWPKGEIDHVDGDRANNKWANLRDVPTSVNAQNKRQSQRNSKTGVLGVSWAPRESKFVARIMVEGRYRSLGQFDSIGAASEAYIAAKRQFHAGCTI